MVRAAAAGVGSGWVGVASGEEWRGGSDRSGDEETFWFCRKNPAGKVFRRRVVVAGRLAGGGGREKGAIHGGAAMVVAAMMMAVAVRDSGGEVASGGEWHDGS
nr:hypothetical protein [Tanacetum cinerariifolium]